MRRREFIALAGAATVWPTAPRAQRSRPLIGFLGSGPAVGFEPMIAGFRDGLAEAGYVEGRNVDVEFRWADGQYDRLPSLAAELVKREVTVILASGAVLSALAAKAATSTIPVIIATGADPVEFGLVSSLARPGGNVTGVHMLSATLGAKRLELIRELVPTGKMVAVLVHSHSPGGEAEYQEIDAAARAIGQSIFRVEAASDSEFDAAFATIVQRRASGLVLGTDTFFNTQRERLVALAAQYRLPAIYGWREFAASGGLISYGSNRREEYRLAGIYVGKILGGTKPGDLPVQQATKVELVINLKTAKTLGLTIPVTLLGRADEVIE
ncbi:MAG: ABC transporter substrate-binding protein [Proteobacteria bacterium]|nr:ABC transporter substrate-binding protein [Pseudomonadota bacterium]